MKGINWTYVIVAIVLGVSIVVYGGLTFYSRERDRQAEVIRLEEQKDAAGLAGQEAQVRRSNLQLCLDSAQVKFDRILELNSKAAPQKDYPDARQWDSSYIKESTEKTFQDDKEICIKLYGN